MFLKDGVGRVRRNNAEMNSPSLSHGEMRLEVAAWFIFPCPFSPRLLHFLSEDLHSASHSSSLRHKELRNRLSSARPRETSGGRTEGFWTRPSSTFQIQTTCDCFPRGPGGRRASSFRLCAFSQTNLHVSSGVFTLVLRHFKRIRCVIFGARGISRSQRTLLLRSHVGLRIPAASFYKKPLCAYVTQAFFCFFISLHHWSQVSMEPELERWTKKKKKIGQLLLFRDVVYLPFFIQPCLFSVSVAEDAFPPPPPDPCKICTVFLL